MPAPKMSAPLTSNEIPMKNQIETTMLLEILPTKK